MNSENIKNNDPLQLRQMIIFLKAELARHKHEVKKYQNSYHYSVVENLEQENIQLTNEKNELAEELVKLNQEIKKRASDYKGPVQLRGIQGNRFIASIDTFQKTKTDLLPISKQLTEVINKLKDGVNSDQQRYKKNDRQVSSLHKKLENNKTTIDQLEYKLVDLIQEANKQVHSQLEKLDISNKERTQSEKVRQRLLIELEEKNNTIGKLQHEIVDLKGQIDKHTEVVAIEEQNVTNKTTIARLENKLVDLIQEANKQVHSQLGKLDIANKERTRFEEVRQQSLIELEEKNNTIGKLQHEIADLKGQIEKHTEVVAIEEQNVTNKTTIARLENKLVDLIREENKQVHLQLEKLFKVDKERTQLEEVRQQSLIELEEKNNTIGKLQHQIADLKGQIDKHTEVVAIEEQNLTNKTTIARLENKLVDLIREENKQVHSQLEKLSKVDKERTQLEEVRQQSLIELEEKNNTIGELQHQIADLKGQNEKHTEAIAIEEENLTNKTTIDQLEYKLVDLIREENKQVHSQLEKLSNVDKERTQLEEVRQQSLIELEEKNNTIGKLQQQIADLKGQNEKHTEAIAIEEENLTNKTTIARLENKLVDLIQEENKQVHSQLKKLDIANKERIQTEKVRQRLLIELEEKNNTIGELQHQIADLKEQNEKHSEVFTRLEKSLNQNNDSQAGRDSFTSTTTPTIDTETLIQLDHQIKEIVAKSLDYEEKLDAKLLVVNTLEEKLNQLTDEIDGIKNFSVEGRGLKGI
ncbi:hypothetical protein [Sporosarcina sp. BP05]|uniref:hypothetical protein n=1 Tax=Sporosarcina sp. BP05 TaxID=2758726 RepID=UPI001646AC25|nr:hypothetical protein [Sporosarcina sp. BP05]